MSDERGEYCLDYILDNGFTHRIMIGASEDEINAALDNLDMCYLDHSMWLVFNNGSPMLVNPDHIIWAGRCLT